MRSAQADDTGRKPAKRHRPQSSALVQLKVAERKLNLRGTAVLRRVKYSGKTAATNPWSAPRPCAPCYETRFGRLPPGSKKPCWSRKSNEDPPHPRSGYVHCPG